MNYGSTSLDLDTISEFLQSIDNEFSAENYNLINKNCNHFTNELCVFLTGKQIPDDVLNQVKSISDTKLGGALLPFLQKLGRESVPDMFEKK